jgi:MSHA biogenesis protein MshN
MSLINKVLRDLDNRQSASGVEPNPPAEVRVVTAGGGHEWFWRTVAFLVLAALGWVGWVFYQIQPRPIATELALEAAEKKASKPAPQAVARAVPAPVPPPVVPQKPVAEPVAPPPAAKPAPPPETLRFAYQIDTPIGAPAPKAEPKPKAEAKKKVAPEKPRFERRDVALTPAERADTEFRRGVDLLKRGRSTEAEAAFRSALTADSTNRGARQALVALKMERGDLEDASRLLRETLTIDPGQPEFAVALARIHVERGRLLDALTVLDGAAGVADAHGDQLHVLRGTVLQRLGRHAQAADAYRAALRAQSATPQAWLGLGISLEALEKRPEAAQAFRNALVAGPVSAELRTFAEQRIQALR